MSFDRVRQFVERHHKSLSVIAIAAGALAIEGHQKYQASHTAAADCVRPESSLCVQTERTVSVDESLAIISGMFVVAGVATIAYMEPSAMLAARNERSH